MVGRQYTLSDIGTTLNTYTHNNDYLTFIPLSVLDFIGLYFYYVSYTILYWETEQKKKTNPKLHNVCGAIVVTRKVKEIGQLG